LPVPKKTLFFLSPERAATYQPRATPWVNGRLVFSPERALHKKSDKTCNALSGLKNLLDFYPGRCPGLVCCCPFRAKKNNIRLYEKRILFTGNFGYTQLINKANIMIVLGEPYLSLNIFKYAVIFHLLTQV